MQSSDIGILKASAAAIATWLRSQSFGVSSAMHPSIQDTIMYPAIIPWEVDRSIVLDRCSRMLTTKTPRESYTSPLTETKPSPEPTSCTTKSSRSDCDPVKTFPRWTRSQLHMSDWPQL